MNSRASRWLLATTLSLSPLVLLAAVAPALHPPVRAGIALGFVAAAAAVVAWAAASPLDALVQRRLALTLGTLGGGLMAAGFVLGRVSHGHVMLDVLSGWLGSAGVLAVASAIGATVGTRIAHPGHLMAVAFASSAADLWSVHAPQGVTHALVATADPTVQRLFSVSAAVPPSRTPDAMVGIGDVMFVALYVATAARHQLPRTRMMAAMLTGLLAAGACTLVFARPLPALPFLGVAVLALQPRARAVPRRDRFATALAGVLVLVSAWFAWR